MSELKYKLHLEPEEFEKFKDNWNNKEYSDDSSIEIVEDENLLRGKANDEIIWEYHKDSGDFNVDGSLSLSMLHESSEATFRKFVESVLTNETKVESVMTEDRVGRWHEISDVIDIDWSESKLNSYIKELNDGEDPLSTEEEERLRNYWQDLVDNH